MKHCIGDISVHLGEPPEGNPYRKESLCGDERANALHDFHERKPTPKYTFWVAPCHGGAKRATWDDVNWETLGTREDSDARRRKFWTPVTR